MKCPFIEGAESLLTAAKDRIDMHVVSGTPKGELRGVIEERGLASFFRSIRGAPTTKIDAFGLRGNKYEAPRVVAIGDSMTEF